MKELSIEYKKEFIAYYEKYGPRKTEEHYGLDYLQSTYYVSGYKKSIAMASYKTITQFVKESSEKEINDFIEYYNAKGSVKALKKFKVKRFSNLNISSVKYLVSKGLKISNKLRKFTIYDMIDHMRKFGYSFDYIKKELIKTYEISGVLSRINMYKHDHHIKYRACNKFIITDELKEYLKTHTIAETAKHFNTDYSALWHIISRSNLFCQYRYNETKLSVSLKTNKDETIKFMNTHTVKEIATKYGTDIKHVYYLLKKHNINHLKKRK